jgi:nitroreductase
MEKPAPVDHPIEESLRRRWSPRAYAPKVVERERLLQLFEAARWAPSSNNEQPWRYVIATADDPELLDAARSVLSPGNAWATRVPILVCVIARTTWSKDNTPNRHGVYDTGQATGHLLVEATALGIFCHQMAGFDVEKARAVFQVPDGHEPVAMMAIGYSGDPSTLEERRRQQEFAPRTRRPISEFVFSGRFGAPFTPPSPSPRP